ncbi:MAG: NUDIX domain-containing protein [Thermoguttaceae bacterium]
MPRGTRPRNCPAQPARASGGWTLPGGWAAVNEPSREAVERKVVEESGYRVRATKLLAVLDRATHPHVPPFPFAIYLGSATLAHAPDPRRLVRRVNQADRLKYE